MNGRRRAQIVTSAPASSAPVSSAPAGSAPAGDLAAPTRSVGRRLAYGVVIAWIVGWFGFLLVQGICPVP